MSVSKTILIGNLGNDPETTYAKSGNAITKFSLATTSTYKKEKKTSWHRIVAFGKLAEICGEYLKKGSMVYIEGRIEYGSYEKDGITRYTTDIIAEQMRMLGKREEGREGGHVPQDDDVPF